MVTTSIARLIETIVVFEYGEEASSYSVKCRLIETIVVFE